jgi:hypothetical protein
MFPQLFSTIFPVLGFIISQGVASFQPPPTFSLHTPINAVTITALANPGAVFKGIKLIVGGTATGIKHAFGDQKIPSAPPERARPFYPIYSHPIVTRQGVYDSVSSYNSDILPSDQTPLQRIAQDLISQAAANGNTPQVEATNRWRANNGEALTGSMPLPTIPDNESSRRQSWYGNLLRYTITLVVILVAKDLLSQLLSPGMNKTLNKSTGNDQEIGVEPTSEILKDPESQVQILSAIEQLRILAPGILFSLIIITSVYLALQKDHEITRKPLLNNAISIEAIPILTPELEALRNINRRINSLEEKFSKTKTPPQKQNSKPSLKTNQSEN